MSTTIIIEEAEDRTAIAGSSDLAHELLVHAARLRRLARAAGDGVIHDEIVALAAHCDAAAAAITAHRRGHRAQLISALRGRSADLQ